MADLGVAEWLGRKLDGDAICGLQAFVQSVQGRHAERHVVQTDAALAIEGAGVGVGLPEGDHHGAIGHEFGRVGGPFADLLKAEHLDKEASCPGDIGNREANVVDPLSDGLRRRVCRHVFTLDLHKVVDNPPKTGHNFHETETMDRLTAMDAFVRVVEAGSFSAAARQWGRSKAVVSKYVGQLEDHLGVTLIRRTTRSLSLTEAGRDFHLRCREVLSDVEALESSVRAQQRALRGCLRVSAPPGFASRYLDELTTSFTAQHPEVRIELDLTYRMVDLIEEGIDIAIRVTEPKDSTLIARRLAPAPIVAVAAPAYLERAGTPGQPAELVDHRCLVDTNFRDQQRWRFRVAEPPATSAEITTVAVDGPFRVNSPGAIRSLTLAGQGIALIPRYMIDSDLASGDLVEILPGRVALNWSVFAVYPRRRYLARRIRAYVDHLAAALSAS